MENIPVPQIALRENDDGIEGPNPLTNGGGLVETRWEAHVGWEVLSEEKRATCVPPTPHDSFQLFYFPLVYDDNHRIHTVFTKSFIGVKLISDNLHTCKVCNVMHTDLCIHL